MYRSAAADHKLNWHYLQIAIGNDAMLTEPKKLADILIELVD
nr:hypothetical protein [Sphingobacterium multivorum]